MPAFSRMRFRLYESSKSSISVRPGVSHSGPPANLDDSSNVDRLAVSVCAWWAVHATVTNAGALDIRTDYSGSFKSCCESADGTSSS